MDREFGFREDAEDNMRLLLRWTNAADPDTRLSEAMKDFPARKLAFKFDWSKLDADVAIATDDSSLVDGRPVRSHGAISLKRRIESGASGWTASSDPGPAYYQLGDWPADARSLEWSMLFFLTSSLMKAPTIKIARNGNFDAVPDADSFSSKLAVQVASRLDQLSAQSDPASVDANAREVKAAFSRDFVEASAALDYGLETGTWIGARLDQSVWYQMTTPLFLPALGLGHYVVNQDITFALTRQVPCTADAPSHLCAEIVLHATPVADDLKKTVSEVNRERSVPASQSVHYWARTSVRLVVDPATLLPYVRDVSQSWFVALDGGDSGKNHPIAEKMRAVSTVSYH